MQGGKVAVRMNGGDAKPLFAESLYPARCLPEVQGAPRMPPPLSNEEEEKLRKVIDLRRETQSSRAQEQVDEDDAEGLFEEEAEVRRSMLQIDEVSLPEGAEALAESPSSGHLSAVVPSSLLQLGKHDVDPNDDPACPNPKYTVAEHAETLVGKFQWGLPAMSDGGAAPNAFEKWAKRKNGVQLFPVANFPNSRINCWESILVTAMDAGVLDKDKARDVLKENMANDMDYNELIQDWLDAGMAKSIKSKPPTRGDVLLWFGGGGHVALSLGGQDVLSLWHGPNGDDTFQRTTIGALNAMLWSDKCAFARSLVAGLTTGCVSDAYSAACEGDMGEQIMDDAYDVIDACNYGDKISMKMIVKMRKASSMMPILKLNPWPHIMKKLAGV